MALNIATREFIKRKQAALRSELDSTERAVYALMCMRKRFSKDTQSESLLNAWYADEQRLEIQLHNYNEMLSL